MALGTNRERIIDVFAEQFDDMIVECQRIIEAHSIITSRATSLDSIGLFFDMERRIAESDANFRYLLENLINIYASAGTKEAIRIFLSAFLVIDVEIIKIFETYPGNITIYLPADFIDEEEAIREAALQVVALGVTVDFIWATTYWDDPEAEWDTDDYWV